MSFVLAILAGIVIYCFGFFMGLIFGSTRDTGNVDKIEKCETFDDISKRMG